MQEWEKVWKNLVLDSQMFHITAPLERLITWTHFSECPREALLSPFKDEKSKHRNTKFSCLRSHIFLWHSQEQNVPFESYARIFNTILLFLTAMVRRDTGAEKEKEGKIMCNSQLGTYTGSQIYLTHHTGFFFLFSIALCVYLLLKRLAGSAGAQVNVDSRLTYAASAWRTAQATNPGWLQMNLCRANLVISNLYYQAYKRHLRDSIQIQQNCVSGARLGWYQHTCSVMDWKRRHYEMWMGKISPDFA